MMDVPDVSIEETRIISNDRNQQLVTNPFSN